MAYKAHVRKRPKNPILNPGYVLIGKSLRWFDIGNFKFKLEDLLLDF